MRIGEYFFSTDTEKSTLHRRITPTQEQRDQQTKRWNDLCDYLKGDLGEKTDAPMYSWLQGSYKMGTQIRPVSKSEEFDIDLGIYFSWPGNPEDNFGAKYLKSLVQKSIESYADEAGEGVYADLVPKKRCARIHYPGGFHIDVPTYHVDMERDARSLATEADLWEESDPKKLYVWFRSNFTEDTDTQVQRIIRYLKMYFALHINGDAPSSILITVLATEAYTLLPDAELTSDDTALRHVAAKIAERLETDIKVPNPVNTEENLNRLNDDANNSFVEQLWRLVDLGDRALASDSQFETVAIWIEAFQHFFPSPIPDNNDSAVTAIIPVDFIPIVDVRAISKTNAQAVYTGTDRIGPIPRQCNIKFTLRNANQLPVGARVHWIVRNEGQEAELTNDMGHPAGEGPVGRDENSAYLGTHFMDVTIFSQFGTVLGFKRLPVKIHGLVVPLRNPKKPGYLRFKKKR
jgi:hypothetical protein